MKTRIIAAAVILPVALAILLILPPYALAFTLSVISAIAAYELMTAVGGTCKRTPSPRAAIYAMIAAVMMPLAVYLNGMFGIALYMSVLVIFFILMCLVIIDFLLTQKSEKRVRLRQLLVTPIAAMVIPLMLASLVGLRIIGFGLAPAGQPELGRLLVMLPVIATVITDSGAYFTGVAIGKHKPLPNISPNKTVEGFIGGIVIGILFMLGYGLIINAATAYTVSIPVMLLYGFAGAVVTEIGDLAFSLIKRKCGIKDYGSLIPGHGGILDRFDSMIFTAPAMLLLVMAVPAIR